MDLIAPSAGAYHEGPSLDYLHQAVEEEKPQDHILKFAALGDDASRRRQREGLGDA